MEDPVYEGPEPKRLVVAIGVDMAKGYEEMNWLTVSWNVNGTTRR